jgi:trigger factor
LEHQRAASFLYSKEFLVSSDTQLDETLELKKLNLTVDVKNTSACERHVKVSIAREDIDRYFQKQFDEIAPRAELPGFRAGKAPRKLLESKFRKQIENQVKGSLLMDSLAQVNEGKHFSAISEPDLDYEQINVPETGPMTYEFDIEVRPEFELPNWQGLKIKRPEREFTEADVDTYVKRLAREQADLVPVDGGIKADDEVVFNITGTIDGNQVVSVNEKMIGVLPTLLFNDGKIEGFDKLAIGKKAGDKFKTKFAVSDFAENTALQGKTIDLEFEVLDVKRVDTENMADLAKHYGLESADELREQIKKTLENQLSYEQHRQIREQISSLLTESANWELPPDLVKRQFRRELNRAVMELKSSGFSKDVIQARENILRHDAKNRTETLLKEHFILERIAEEKNIEDEPADYEFEIAKIAMQSNDSPRRVRARLEKNGQIDVLRNLIIERKVIGMIEEAAEFQSVPYTLDVDRKVEAVDFSLTGTDSGEIPEAKFDEQPDKPIPGVGKDKQSNPNVG